MDKSYKIPLLASLKWSFQWAVAVVLRHQKTTAAYVAAGVVAGLLASSGLGGLLLLVYSLASIPLALLTHAEVLRGPSALDAQTLGQGPGRMVGYLIDTILIGLAAGLSALVPIFAIAMLSGPASMGSGVDLVLAFLVVTVVAVVASRPALRLPSRVLGDPISWSQAWRLGQGNTLALVLGPFLISVPVLIVEQIVQLLVPETLSDVVSMVLLPAQIVLTCAFLSVAYGQLRRANPEL
ncbi:hypothetical protein [Xanthobacter versatilis]|uniref:Uncharacterized protein n=1 Tax=Xanthobacter autotrophicus (strain ATCC BAA-1158 / Py2) TaxID=78245 RepID=A7IL78_XANP2|nr:hypothetical protein Xaut_3543 [Xanthobacter autotrophicus Py2]